MENQIILILDGFFLNINKGTFLRGLQLLLSLFFLLFEIGDYRCV
jgi:hypothetical protein